MANSDRRDTYRLDLPEDRVRVSAPTVGRMIVADLSASGSGLIVHPDDFERVTAEPATFELDSGRSFRVRLEPVRITRGEGRLRVGARFQDLPVSGMRVLSEFLIREFLEEKGRLGRLLEDPRTLTNDSPTFIRRHLRRCLIGEKRHLRVYDHGQLLPFRIGADRIIEFNGRTLIEGRCSAAGLLEGGVYTFVIALPGSVTHFSSSIEHRSGEMIYVRLPTELHQAGFRDSVRTPIQSRHGGASVRCVHPRLPEELIHRPLLDLSARGFAFASEPESDLLFPGDRLSFIRIRFDDDVFEASGIIRRIAPHRDSDLYSCGVEIAEFADEAQERRWRERVFQYVHPRAVVTEPRVAARYSWRVLEESGYVRLWTPAENRERLKESYSRAWSDGRQEMGRLMLVQSEGETVGTLAGSVLYPKTWLVHQLGVDERERNGLGNFLSLSYELYSGLMYLFQHEAAAEYFVIYAERDRRWTQTLYENFVAQCPDRDAFSYVENCVFRRVIGSPVSRIIPRNTNVEVTIADADALRLVAQALQATHSPLECNALAFGPTEIDLLDFSERCRQVGFERSRRVFVARESGMPVAALVAESGGEGVNLFGLMNRCFIVNLRSEPLSPLVKATLLVEGERYFHQLEKQLFIFFDDPDADRGLVKLLGFEFVSEGMRFIASKRVVPSWLSYLANVLSLRQAAQGA